MKNRLIDWQRVDTALLDMDGTLLDLHFDDYFWQHHLPLRYAEKHQIDLQQAKGFLKQRFDSKQHTLHWYCLDFWSDELAMDIVALKREVKHLIQTRPHTMQFLQALKAAKKEIWLVTNAHSDTINLKLEHTPLAPWLDNIVSSHSFGVPKEDLGFWHAMQIAHPFLKSRALFVDDNIHVLRAARDYGIEQLLCITQPSSTAVASTVTEFPAVQDFSQILPIL